MFFSTRTRLRDARRAFTLVELLVAVAIAALLIAIAIPALKINLRGQSIREAARQINSFIDEAKSQAAGTGRPYGVIIERDGDGSYGNLSRSFRLYHCEVQPPYIGEFMPSPGNADPRMRQGSRAFFVGPAAWNSGYGVYVGDAILSFAIDRMVTPGDEIAFDGSSVRYTIISVTDATPSDLVGPTTAWVRIKYMHPTAQTPSQVTEEPYDNYDGTPTNEFRPTVDVAARGHSFRVYRQPVKIASSVLELPRSAAIDLDWSGVGIPGDRDLSASATANPMRGMEFSDLRGPNLAAITILFEPSGGVRTVTTSWCLNPAAAANYRFALESRTVFDPVYFLVARLDRVEDAVTPAGNWLDPSAEIPSNIHDPDAMWIKINPATGTTLTVPNQGAWVRDPLTGAMTLPAALERVQGVRNARELARLSSGAEG